MVETTQDIHESIRQLLIRASLQATLAAQQLSIIQIQNSINPKSPFLASPSKPKLSSSYPIKYLTYSKMQELRDLDLCLNCQEQYTPGHRCQQKRILLILPEDEHALQTIEPKLEEPQKQDITVHALPTILDPTALPFQAAVLNRPIATLIDPSTTHHYLLPKSAHFLGLQIDKSSTFSVFVGNEDKIRGPSHNDYTFYCMDQNECMIKTGKSKVFIFDPGGKMESKSLFVARFMHGEGQLNHNPSSTSSTPLPPTYDLEDKVDFKGMVMIRQL